MVAAEYCLRQLRYDDVEIISPQPDIADLAAFAARLKGHKTLTFRRRQMKMRPLPLSLAGWLIRHIRLSQLMPHTRPLIHIAIDTDTTPIDIVIVIGIF